MKNYAKESHKTFAIGFSKTNFGDAERDAVKHLKRRNWSWKPKNGYQVVLRKPF